MSVMIYGKRYLIHRLIYLYHYGELPKEIDHINGIKDDNRIENLRPCTRAENLRNRKGRSKTGAKGVYFSASGNYVVNLTINKTNKNFGTYSDFELAELVAIEARNKYYGEFANHDTPI